MEKIKKIKELPRVWNISGGRTSGYMVIKYYRPGDLVLFTDTGREHPKTYKFLNDFEAFEGIPIIRTKYTDFVDDAGNDTPFKAFLRKRKFREIPNKFKRECTKQLKIATAKKLLKSLGILSFINFIGYRADESQRVMRRIKKYQKVFDKFPLHEDGTTKSDVNYYWKQKALGYDILKNKSCTPYTLEIPSILGNCDLCFMKGKNAIISILTVHPKLAEPWIEDEETDIKGNTYFNGVTIRQLLNIAQNNLFKEYDLEEMAPAFDCACGP